MSEIVIFESSASDHIGYISISLSISVVPMVHSLENALSNISARPINIVCKIENCHTYSLVIKKWGKTHHFINDM